MGAQHPQNYLILGNENLSKHQGGKKSSVKEVKRYFLPT
jgi:hypothetical protein